ncbi:MAG: bifunctional diaminohydroxyphosphoribosylaminopyrimidine deaminase/5-amino-6-(5-phosphoribosylamino)uracil reductase RibD [Peptoniphilaceae bacterium]|nr:bifunctional diaminohydroxyphosphoribosylaminopyrimidine deaminase/5-amino-6-(5-phosphoribosylamino)uracil reductase RibD [Peptoniphilaceae bacterium]MDY6019436.1 bifunctional diaminohydroxyphosphoribosylaminopyrimidine deaminase/5-amino-6-(5-phosphoribosylamino)uracil reductase RibD [Anaerococcus sp.]
MNDKDYMKKVFDLAKKGVGHVSPNPLVGALIVKNGKIIGQGYHEHYGMAHAERNAIENASESVEGATLYCNLEPCSHVGKQPPCADLLIEKKIKKVVISNLDNNPKVDSIQKLKDAGIEVEIGLLEDQGRKLNEIFFYNMKYGKIFIALKYAMTLDGKIATENGDSKRISCEKSRTYVHQLRSRYDAILVGKNTVEKDDPQLTSRIDGGVDPIRVILDTNFSLDKDKKIFNLKSDKKTYIATISDKNRPEIKAEVIRCKEDKGKIDLEDLCQKLYQRNIRSLLVEGGASVNNSFLEANLINKIYAFISPQIISGYKSKAPFFGLGVNKIKDSYKFKLTDVKRYDEDVLIEADNVYWNS